MLIAQTDIRESGGKLSEERTALQAMEGPAVGRNNETWFNLQLSHEDQVIFIDKFRSYVAETSGYSGENLLEVIRKDFTIEAFTLPTVIANYEIYKRVKKFLEENSVLVASSVDGHTNVFERVVYTLWPGEDMAAARRQAYLRMLDVRSGHEEKAHLLT